MNIVSINIKIAKYLHQNNNFVAINMKMLSILNYSSGGNNKLGQYCSHKISTTSPRRFAVQLPGTVYLFRNGS